MSHPIVESATVAPPMIFVGDEQSIAPPPKTPEAGGLIVSQSDSLPSEPVQYLGVQLQKPQVAHQRSVADLQRDLDTLLQCAHLNGDVAQKVSALIPEMARKIYESSEDFDIELSQLTTDISTAQKELQLKEIQRVRELNKTSMEDNVKKMAESQTAATEAKKSGLAAKIFGWFSAIASIIVGAIMCATGVGAAAGALMIAAGIMGVVTNAVQQAAADGLISKEVMAVLGPVLTAVEMAIAAVTAVVTFGGAAAGAIAKLGAKVGSSALEMLGRNVVGMVAKQGLEMITSQATKVAAWAGKVTEVAGKSLSHGVDLALKTTQLGIDVGSGVTQSVNQGMQVTAGLKQADTTQARAEMNAINAVMDRLTADLRRILDTFTQVMEQISQMLSAKSKNLHNLSSLPSSI